MIKCFPIWRMMCSSERKAKIIHSKPGHGEIESCHFTIGCIICLLAVCHLVANQTWDTACRYQKVQALYTHVKLNTFFRHQCVILAHIPVLRYVFGRKQLDQACEEEQSSRTCSLSSCYDEINKWTSLPILVI